MGTRFQFYTMKNVLCMDGSDDCMTIRMYLMSLNCILKSGSDGTFYIMYMSPQFLKK